MKSIEELAKRYVGYLNPATASWIKTIDLSKSAAEIYESSPLTEQERTILNWRKSPAQGNPLALICDPVLDGDSVKGVEVSSRIRGESADRIIGAINLRAVEAFKEFVEDKAFGENVMVKFEKDGKRIAYKVNDDGVERKGSTNIDRILSRKDKLGELMREAVEEKSKQIIEFAPDFLNVIKDELKMYTGSRVPDEKFIETYLKQVLEAKEKLGQLGDRVQDFSALGDILEVQEKMNPNSQYFLDSKNGLSGLKNEESFLEICRDLASYLSRSFPNVNDLFGNMTVFDPKEKSFSININDKNTSLRDLNDSLNISDITYEFIRRETALKAYTTMRYGALPDLGYPLDSKVYLKELQAANDYEKMNVLVKKIANDYTSKLIETVARENLKCSDEFFPDDPINKSNIKAPKTGSKALSHSHDIDR